MVHRGRNSCSNDASAAVGATRTSTTVYAWWHIPPGGISLLYRFLECGRQALAGTNSGSQLTSAQARQLLCWLGRGVQSSDWGEFGGHFELLCWQLTCSSSFSSSAVRIEGQCPTQTGSPFLPQDPQRKGQGLQASLQTGF